MKPLILFTLALICSVASAQPSADMGKTLVVYYSFTGNVSTIVSQLTEQISADIAEVKPAEEGLDYAADNYAIGSRLISAIRSNPDAPESYPDIKPIDADLAAYDNIIIATPLWWSQMAAPMQTFLFRNASQLAGKHVGLIVSSASSGISSVVADAQRLLPDVQWTGDALWVNNRNRSQAPSLITQWLEAQSFQPADQTTQIFITIDGQTHSITLASTQAASELAARLHEGPVSVTLSSSGGFEIWGPLGFTLTADNQQTTAQPGDVILYNGSNICLFYGTNSWSYTRLGKIDDLTESELPTFLKAGDSNIPVTLSLASDPTAVKSVDVNRSEEEAYYSLNGVKVTKPSKGLYIKGSKKIAL